tara:strand:+ start:251 stop:508 length:258 start_codon:yes stop_codon:yes gene_type:complete
MSELNRFEIPESAKQSLRALLAQRQQVEQLINTYVRALKDGFNIEGDGWVLELQDMVFVQQSPNGKAERSDVVEEIERLSSDTKR